MPTRTDEPVDDQIKPKDTFDKWTVLEFAGKHRSTSPAGARCTADLWECRCKCGNVQKVLRCNLLRDLSKQCKACSCAALTKRRKESASPDSKRQNLSISGKYRRICIDGCPATWDWLAFLTWFRALEPEQQVGVPQRRDTSLPHGPDNTYFVRNPIRTSHIAIIAEMCDLSVEAATTWADSVSRQAVELRANKLREKKASA